MKRRRKLQLHPNGQYCAQIMRQGVSKSFFLGRNRKQADKKLDQLEQDIASGKIQFAAQETSQVVLADGSKDIRIEELAVQHLEWVKANRSGNTFLLRQHFVSLFCNYVGPKMVSVLTSETMEGFLAWYRSRKKEQGRVPVKGGHAIREIRSMFRWGEQHKLCCNPIDCYPQIHGFSPSTRHFTDEDFAALLKAVPCDFADLLIFGTLTGLRPQELRGLQRQNTIDQQGRVYVSIEHHKTSDSSKVPIPRTVPLSTEAAAIVQRQLNAHPKSAFIFLNDDGTSYSSGALRRRLQRWCKRAGVPIMPPYALRHVFGTRQARNGTNLSIVAQLMGHTNINTTARYIINCDPAHLNAVDVLAKQIMPLVQRARAEAESAGTDARLVKVS